MGSTFDLDRAVASLVETAKGNLQRDGRLQPVGIMFLPGQDMEVVPLDLKSAQSKDRSMDTLFRMAEAKAALAVVTIIDAYRRDVPPEIGEAFLAGYERGDLARDPQATECIMVAVLVPGVEAASITVPYARDGGGTFRFGAPRRQVGMEGMCVPAWAHARGKPS